MLRCLWVARDIPFPLDAGDKVYSAHLARALADSGVFVRFLGYSGGRSAVPADWPVDWVAVPGGKRSTRSAVLSSRPHQAAIHDTPAYRRMIREQMREEWDAIVLDSYGSGWALRHARAVLADPEAHRPVCVYVSHNHESRLWRGMVRTASGGPGRRAALWQNYLKICLLERALVRNVDLVAAITPEDAAALAAYGPRTRSVVLTPGHSGSKAPPRVLDARTPRHVVTLGSFRWVVKQENLKRFIAAADERFHASGIIFDVVGDVPPQLIAMLGSNLKATRFHGFVADAAPHLADARIAVVPELLGGGFKLKFLDYIFGRIPVATLTDAAAGLPGDLRGHLIRSRDIHSLVDDIIANIDDIERLNALQESAFRAASSMFRWRDRGADFLGALGAAIECRSPAPLRAPL
jgi:glycosyltransferase involved in cell wall biosynthesis